MTYTDQDILRATKEHVAAMTELHEAQHQAITTLATLIAMVEERQGQPVEGGPLFAAGDAASAALGAAYEQARLVTEGMTW